MEEEKDYVIIWEPKPLEKPEFRLYYDDSGKVLFYTCEKPEGNYVVVDAVTYAQSRMDIRIINGKISNASSNGIISKLMPDISGINCYKEDVSIIVDSDENIQKWKLKVYEL